MSIAFVFFCLIDSVAMPIAVVLSQRRENDGCRLRVSDVLEDGAEGGGLLTCGEEGSVFSFSGTGDDAGYDCRETMNSSVYLCWL